MEIDLSLAQLQGIYGDRMYVVPEYRTSLKKGPVIWKPKAESKVLFIIHRAELKQKELGDLLKKIVESIEIPFEQAGFGIIAGKPQLDDLLNMPNPYGVVFDYNFVEGGTNPVDKNGNRLYITRTLQELAENREYKMELWGFLKEIKTKIS